MAKDTLTIELGGRVEIADLNNGIDAFRRLVHSLTPRNAGIAWLVDDLQSGSAIVTLRGEAANPVLIERVVDDYGKVGSALARHESLHQFDSRVVRAANAVAGLTKAVEYVRFETPDVDYTIYPNGDQRVKSAPKVSIGAITGRVQTLSSRAGRRFNLYDTLFDKAVACYLTPGQEEIMRQAWGQRARVSGRISREADTGRPTAIRNIMNVEILEDVPSGSYRLARGAVPWQPGDNLPEDVIRELRDA